METEMGDRPVGETIAFGGPTRWGNQLNGNSNTIFGLNRQTGSGPTRWGNQLNGNSKTELDSLMCFYKAPLAGAIS